MPQDSGGDLWFWKGPSFFNTGAHGGGLHSHLGWGWAGNCEGREGELVPISQGRRQRWLVGQGPKI